MKERKVTIEMPIKLEELVRLATQLAQVYSPNPGPDLAYTPDIRIEEGRLVLWA